MEYLSKDGEHLSNEMIFALALMLEMIHASTIIAYKMEKKLKLCGIEINLVQKHKQAFKEAERLVKRIAFLLDEAFDPEMRGAAKGDPWRWEEIERQANDLIQTLLIYESRVDFKEENRERLKKAMLKYKGSDDYPIDELREFFKMIK